MQPKNKRSIFGTVGWGAGSVLLVALLCVTGCPGGGGGGGGNTNDNVACETNADCDDGLFCNGDETCTDGTCADGEPPCPAEDCVENADFCPECTDDADCDDGDFCNGAETCNDQRECEAGTDPCDEGETCDEAGDECVPDNGNVNENDNVANQPPTADAGDDQNVTVDDPVTLDGSGSTDPDDDVADLTFEWTAPAGITLSDVNAQSPTFTADTAGSFSFTLTVTDPDGASDDDEVTVNVAAIPRLFIANFTGDSVVHYANPADVNGNIAPVDAGGGNLQGAQTLLNDPADIVVNANNQLLAANFTGNSITTYDNASEVNGNQERDGNLAGAATLLVDPVTLAINEAADLLFVADLNGAGAARILVFAETTDTLNGNLAPTRTISSGDLQDPLGINFGADDDLYVANSGAVDNVLVFANASNLNGTVAATRIITNAEFDSIFDVFIDGNDTMFVVDSFDDEIYIFNNAADLNGAESPDFTLTVTGAGTLTAIAVDSNDIGYIVDFAASAIYSYDDISTQNGALTPDRTISGANTQLSGPIRVFLTE